MKLNEVYIVYGKHKNDKRFKPFDMKNNKFVINLFYASLFFEKDLKDLTNEVEYMNKYNENFVFEIRTKG